MERKETQNQCDLGSNKKKGYDPRISSQEYPFFVQTLCDMVANGKNPEILQNNQNEEIEPSK